MEDEYLSNGSYHQSPGDTTVTTSPGAGDPPEQDSSSTLLEKAIRGIVRDEMNYPPRETGILTPKGSDAFWLFILLGNITFVLWFLSESQVASEKLDLLTKIVPWLGTSAFALGYTWARDKVLALTRHGLFKIGQLLLFLVLFLSQLPILSIRPAILPQDALAKIADQKEPRKDGERIWLTLGTYKVKIDLLTRQPADDLTTSAEFELGYPDLLGSWWGKGGQPHWYLKYRSDIGTSGANTDITITKTDSSFDKSFLNSNLHTYENIPVNIKDANTLHIRGTEKVVGDLHSLDLPFGVYEIRANYLTCQKESDPQVIDMKNRGVDRFYVKFGECQ